MIDIEPRLIFTFGLASGFVLTVALLIAVEVMFGKGKK